MLVVIARLKIFEVDPDNVVKRAHPVGALVKFIAETKNKGRYKWADDVIYPNSESLQSVVADQRAVRVYATAPSVLLLAPPSPPPSVVIGIDWCVIAICLRSVLPHHGHRPFRAVVGQCSVGPRRSCLLPPLRAAFRVASSPDSRTTDDAMAPLPTSSRARARPTASCGWSALLLPGQGGGPLGAQGAAFVRGFSHRFDVLPGEPVGPAGRGGRTHNCHSPLVRVGGPRARVAGRCNARIDEVLTEDGSAAASVALWLAARPPRARRPFDVVAPKNAARDVMDRDSTPRR